MTTDKIIGSLVGVSGHTFDIVYDLFFTSERVIAVIIQHPGDGPRRYAPVWQSVFIGSAWTIHENKMEMAKNAQTRRRSLQNTTPDELARSHLRNFEIWYREVASVELKRWFFQPQLRFRIASTGQTIRFNLSSKQLKEARSLLELTPL